MSDNPFADNLEERFEKLQEKEIEKNNEDLLNILNSKIIKKNINQGIYEGKWYYGVGTYLPRKVVLFEKEKSKKDKKKEENSMEDFYSVEFPESVGELLIFSDRSYMINDFRKNGKFTDGLNRIRDFGIFYENSLQVMFNSWQKTGPYSINDFICKPNLEINSKELYEQIKSQILTYMDLIDERASDIITCFVMHSYCHDIFNTVAQIQLQAESGSGKSKLLDLMHLLSYNAINQINTTEANMYREIENKRGVLLLDEYERLKESDRKVFTDTILNAGFIKGNKVTRQRRNGDRWETEEFDIVVPKVVASITGMNEVTESRFIKIKLRKAKESNPKSKLELDKQSPIWSEIRNKCHIWVLKNWKDIQEAYNYGKYNISNRYLDIWKPLLTIAKVCDNVEPVISYAQNLIKEQKLEMAENSFAYQMFYAILTDPNLDDNSETRRTAKEIAQLMASHEEFENDLAKTKFINKRIRKIGFVMRGFKWAITYDRSNSARYWIYKKSNIIDIFKHYAYPMPDFACDICDICDDVTREGGENGKNASVNTIKSDNIDICLNLLKNSVSHHSNVTDVTNVILDWVKQFEKTNGCKPKLSHLLKSFPKDTELIDSLMTNRQITINNGDVIVV